MLGMAEEYNVTVLPGNSQRFGNIYFIMYIFLCIAWTMPGCMFFIERESVSVNIIFASILHNYWQNILTSGLLVKILSVG